MSRRQNLQRRLKRRGRVQREREAFRLQLFTPRRSTSFDGLTYSARMERVTRLYRRAAEALVRHLRYGEPDPRDRS